MIDRPRFRPHFQVQAVPGVGVFLVSEDDQHVLKGRINELVAPCIDGRLSADDIVDRLEASVSPAEVYYALMKMEEQGFIDESDDDAPDAESRHSGRPST